MPVARYLEAGLTVGLGSDVSGGPEASIFSVMRVAAYAQMARRSLASEGGVILDPLHWLRMGPSRERASSGWATGSNRWKRARKQTSSPSIRRSWPPSRVRRRTTNRPTS